MHASIGDPIYPSVNFFTPYILVLSKCFTIGLGNCLMVWDCGIVRWCGMVGLFWVDHHLANWVGPFSDLRPAHVAHWPCSRGPGQLPIWSTRPTPILNWKDENQVRHLTYLCHSYCTEQDHPLFPIFFELIVVLHSLQATKYLEGMVCMTSSQQ